MHKVIQDLHEPLLRRYLYVRDLEKGCKIRYEFIHTLDIINVTYLSYIIRNNKQYSHYKQRLETKLDVSEVLQIDPQFRSDYLRYHALSFAKYIEKEIKKA